MKVRPLGYGDVIKVKVCFLHQQESYRKRTPSPYSSRNHRSRDRRSCRNRSGSGRNSQRHFRPNKRRDQTPSRPHKHQRSKEIVYPKSIQELEKVIQLNTSQDTEKVNMSFLLE